MREHVSDQTYTGRVWFHVCASHFSVTLDSLSGSCRILLGFQILRTMPAPVVLLVSSRWDFLSFTYQLFNQLLPYLDLMLGPHMIADATGHPCIVVIIIIIIIIRSIFINPKVT